MVSANGFYENLRGCGVAGWGGGERGDLRRAEGTRGAEGRSPHTRKQK